MASKEQRAAAIKKAAKLCDPKTCSPWLLRAVDAPTRTKPRSPAGAIALPLP
jgi:hypothetical protein